ncbi:ScbR family autoregulator-binding transcription factor [Streptomyces sp. NPDC058319]|uniref:ScbR family autoregulator-binding transcription factor n=1 Tax=unclassified Streptomyces TaxID=2593676 RepID=UPI0036EF7934
MAQQERAIRTRHAILKAAASVFDERGYEAATIGEILTRAGVTKGALYFHFPSKQALAEGVLNAQFAEVSLAPRVCKLQELVDTGLLTADRMRRDPVVSAAARLSLGQEMRTLFGGQAVSLWIATTEKVLHEAKAQGELLPHVDPAASAWIVSAAWTGVQVYSHTLSDRADLVERVVSLFEHLLPSIAVPAVLGRLIVTAERADEIVREVEQRARDEAGRAPESVQAFGLRTRVPADAE